MYKENPKTKGSGIMCAIPQTGRCPNNCLDCFFQSGRSFLEPLEENLPNMPDLRDVVLYNRIVRVNDGNDSNIKRSLVMKETKQYPMKFYNTSLPIDLEDFDAPVVLTLNPGEMTDYKWHKLDPISNNLMFVRIRTNMWNITRLVVPAVKYYTTREISVILTFMAYYDTMDKIPEHHREAYEFRKRTINSYNAIKTKAWRRIMKEFRDNKYIYSCGREGITSGCKFCGNCLREYFSTMERIRNA